MVILRPSIGLQRFTVITDHKTLKWTVKYKESYDLRARWLLCLLEYGFVIQYRKAARLQAAGALSRL